MATILFFPAYPSLTSSLYHQQAGRTLQDLYSAEENAYHMMRRRRRETMRAVVDILRTAQPPFETF